MYSTFISHFTPPPLASPLQKVSKWSPNNTENKYSDLVNAPCDMYAAFWNCWDPSILSRVPIFKNKLTSTCDSATSYLKYFNAEIRVTCRWHLRGVGERMKNFPVMGSSADRQVAIDTEYLRECHPISWENWMLSFDDKNWCSSTTALSLIIFNNITECVFFKLHYFESIRQVKFTGHLPISKNTKTTPTKKNFQLKKKMLTSKQLFEHPSFCHTVSIIRKPIVVVS